MVTMEPSLKQTRFQIKIKGLEMKKNVIKGLTLAALVMMPTVSMAETFWKTGNITRIVITTGQYGQCMIQIPTLLEHGCTSNWISLDCMGTFSDKGNGDRLLNVALIAQTMEKRVSIKIDNIKKHNTICVGQRIDILP